MRDDFVAHERGGQQAHAAVDVEAHAARRDHPGARVGGGHAADGETVALVDVGHGERRPDDAGQEGDVDSLLEREVGENLLQQRFVGIDECVGAHAGLGAARDEVAAGVELFELRELEAHREFRSAFHYTRARAEGGGNRTARKG